MPANTPPLPSGVELTAMLVTGARSPKTGGPTRSTATRWPNVFSRRLVPWTHGRSPRDRDPLWQ